MIASLTPSKLAIVEAPCINSRDPKVSMKNTLNKRNKILSNILTYSDGSLSAEDISKKIKINYKKVLSEIKFLEKNKLIEI